MHHFRTLKELESQSSDRQQAADEASSTAEAAEQTRRQEQAAAEARKHAAAQEQAHSRERTRRQEQAAAEARKHAAAQEQAHSRERTRRQEQAAAEARRHAAAQEQAHSREQKRRQERAAAEARKHAAAQEQAHSREQTRRQEAPKGVEIESQREAQDRVAAEAQAPVTTEAAAQDTPRDKQRIFYLETLDAFELLESQGKLTPEESARLKTMRLTRSDYLDMARRKLSGNPDATDDEIRVLSEWLFYERDPGGYQKYKTGQVLTEAGRLYEEAGLRDAQDVEDLRAYNASRAERGHKTLARDVLQGVGSLSDDPDEAHKQVEEWGRYIWSVLSPMGFNRDYHLAQAEHDTLREGLAWRVAMAGDKIVEVETEDGGVGYVLQSELDAQERYERELAAFRQQKEPLENLSRLMAQGGDELVLTDQGYLSRSAIEALGDTARLAALSGDELVETAEGYKLRSTIELEDLSLLASRGGDELVLTDQGYLPRSAIEAQQRLGDTARLMAQGGDELVLTDQGYLSRSAIEAQGDTARLAALSGDELVETDEGYKLRSTIELEDLSLLASRGGDELVLTDQGYLPRSAIEEQEQLATQAGDELVLLPDGFGILQSDLEALPDDLQQQAREHGYFMLKPVEDLTDEELDKRLAVTYPGMDVSELPDNAYVLPTGPPGAALAGALEPLPEDATERERKTRALLVPEAEQEAKEGLQRAAISFIPILSTAMYWNDMSAPWKALSVAGDVLFVPGVPGLAVKGALGAAKGAMVTARYATRPWQQAARQLQRSTYLMPARPIAPALSSTGRRLPFEGYERIGRHYLEELPDSLLAAEKVPSGAYPWWRHWKPIDPWLLRQKPLWPDSRLPYFPTDELRRFGRRYVKEDLPGNLLDAEKTPLSGTYTWVQGMPIQTRLLKEGVIKVLPDGKLLVRSRKGDLVFDPKKGIPRSLFPEPALPLDPASTFLKSEGGSTLTRLPGTLAPPRGYTPSPSTTLLSRPMASAAPTVAIGRLAGVTVQTRTSPAVTPVPAQWTMPGPQIAPIPKIKAPPKVENSTPAPAPTPQEPILVPKAIPGPVPALAPTVAPLPRVVPVPEPVLDPTVVPVLTPIPALQAVPVPTPVPALQAVPVLKIVPMPEPILKPGRTQADSSTVPRLRTADEPTTTPREPRRKGRRRLPRLPEEESASPTPAKRRKYPRAVTWLHGPTQFTLDLHTGQESRTYHPNPFNRLPHESFAVASHADTPPPERRLDLGMIDAFVGEHGIRFQLDPAFKRKPIRTQRRPGPLSSRGVL